MSVSAKAVQALRTKTGAGVMDVKQALTEAKGDEQAALVLLKQRGLLKATQKGARAASEGIIHSYIHSNRRIGVLLELNCETDFVARNEEFRRLAGDLCLQIAASHPVCITVDEVPQGSKPVETALLAQPFVKDQQQTVGDVLGQAIAKLGENIRVGRFIRYELGQGGEAA